MAFAKAADKCESIAKQYRLAAALSVLVMSSSSMVQALWFGVGTVTYAVHGMTLLCTAKLVN